MKQLRFAILHGLAQSGTGKTITQILKDAGHEFTHSQLNAALHHLEVLGLIRSDRQQYPVEPAGEVTFFGREILQAAQAS